MIDLTGDQALERLAKIFDQEAIVVDLDDARKLAHKAATAADKKYDEAVIELRKLSRPDPLLPLFDGNGPPAAVKQPPAPEASAAGKLLRAQRTRGNGRAQRASK